MPSLSTAQIRTFALMFEERSDSFTSESGLPLAIRYSISSTLPFANASRFSAVGNLRTRAISWAVAFSGFMDMDRPRSSRMKRSCFSYLGSRTLAMVWDAPSFLASRQISMLISSAPVVAMTRSVSPAPASSWTL